MRWLSMSSTRKADDLGDPQPGGVGGHEDGAVLEAGDRREEPGDLVGAEDDGELLGLLGADEMRSRTHPCAEGDAVEEPQGGEGLVVDSSRRRASPGRGGGGRRGRRRGPRRSGDLPKCLAKVATRST